LGSTCLGKKILNFVLKKFNVQSVDWIAVAQEIVTEFDSRKRGKEFLVS
jgi:hypothetical protein